MSSPYERSAEAAGPVVDYDGDGYDYTTFWRNRDYERWVEARLLSRLLPRLGHPPWFADFGGGFGRNARHYLPLVHRAILVDYSLTNLSRAQQGLSQEIESGRLILLRCDLNQLPLIDGAFDAAMVIRVLHHLTDLRQSLSEMARTVRRTWLVDVPIKHHLLGQARSLVHGRRSEMRSPDPLVTGESEYPFSTFHLPTVRDWLAVSGFETKLVASANNFRRWDQLLPPAAISALRPLVYPGELAVQRLGRGWWGPSQLLLASRTASLRTRLWPRPEGLSDGEAELAQRLCCPICRGDLRWEPRLAHCELCGRDFGRLENFWDFTVR